MVEILGLILALAVIVAGFKYTWWDSKQPLWFQLAIYGFVFVVILFLVGAYQGSQQ